MEAFTVTPTKHCDGIVIPPGKDVARPFAAYPGATWSPDRGVNVTAERDRTKILCAEVWADDKKAARVVICDSPLGVTRDSLVILSAFETDGECPALSDLPISTRVSGVTLEVSPCSKQYDGEDIRALRGQIPVCEVCGSRLDGHGDHEKRKPVFNWPTWDPGARSLATSTLSVGAGDVLALQWLAVLSPGATLRFVITQRSSGELKHIKRYIRWAGGELQVGSFTDLFPKVKIPRRTDGPHDP